MQDISHPLLEHVLAGLDGLPYEVFQIDDDWQQAIGDWEPNAKFPAGMDALARRIRQADRTPGIWWAPFIVSPHSRLFAEHPDWLLRDAQGNLVPAGFNWNAPFFALDTTLPPVQAWLQQTAHRLRAWGYDYFYNYVAPGVQNAIRPSLHRLWLRPLAHTDAYMAFFRTRYNLLQPHEMTLMQEMARMAGFWATSDLTFLLDDHERQELDDFWCHIPQVERLAFYRFHVDNLEVDFSPAVTLPVILVEQ